MNRFEQKILDRNAQGKKIRKICGEKIGSIFQIHTDTWIAGLHTIEAQWMGGGDPILNCKIPQFCSNKFNGGCYIEGQLWVKTSPVDCRVRKAVDSAKLLSSRFDPSNCPAMQSLWCVASFQTGFHHL
ncbi:hypothetical protein [Vacuolonema iberomarrocanum]|uniref:hypothetical protein n=1 Tax=Vacuolonema iberomarrocanum TaxID=3454632 RepID=UPI001A078C3B|nr:hypothetical protein [filamentous cyanobacterium LEGE 07170]